MNITLDTYHRLLYKCFEKWPYIGDEILVARKGHVSNRRNVRNRSCRCFPFEPRQEVCGRAKNEIFSRQFHGRKWWKRTAEGTGAEGALHARGKERNRVRERGALIICTRTSPLSCGRRTRPFQLWHSGLSRLQPGCCSPLSSPKPIVSLSLGSSFLSCSFLRGYRGAPFHPENFNYNRNYPPKKVLPECPQTNNPTARTARWSSFHRRQMGVRAGRMETKNDAVSDDHEPRNPRPPCIAV